LLKLRWSSIAGQIGTILGVSWLIGIKVPMLPLFSIIGVEAASNVACALWFARRPRVAQWHLALVMGLDICLLTCLLFFTGGPFNPFSFLYLVNIALAAVALHAQWTWMLVALALLSFGVLFFTDYRPLAIDHLTLQEGVWVAFGVAAAFIVHFLWRVTGALSRRERELSEARALAARQERLASLATMAAGAAHELATPLGTIALVAGELERGMNDRDARALELEDVRLIREQVARCRSILDHMAGGVGKSEQHRLERVRAGDLCAEAATGLRERPAVELELDQAARGAELRLPPRAVAQALRSLITNAQDASPPSAPVLVQAACADGFLVVEVRDSGVGMSDDQLSRAGDPFYTTKEPGRGMGLGLFLARAVIERLGGTLCISSTEGEGTLARVALPVEPSRPASFLTHADSSLHIDR
jgi:two-component system sensor histidine kinase RegB